jgi:Tol biopolymer transport system component
METDGSHLVRLTQCADDGATCDSPTWSPDGRQIAFFYHRHDYTGPNDKTSGIYLMAADGTSPILLITNSGDGLDWSPTGKELAFHNGGIFVAQVDGSRIVRVISDEKDKPGSHYPSWSPDGERIAFERDNEIYIINADGTAPTRLTQALVQAQFPSWSPNGQKISFVADLEDCFGIATINSDGTHLTCLFRR